MAKSRLDREKLKFFGGGLHEIKHGGFTTTTGGTTVFLTIDPDPGIAYFFDCYVASAEEDQAEPREAAVLHRALYTCSPEGLLFFDGQQELMATSGGYTDVVFGIAANNITVGVEMNNSANWQHWYRLELRWLPLDRYTTTLDPWPSG